MTIAEVMTEVEILIQDTSAELNDPMINYINEALAAISDDCVIPELKVLGSVLTVPGQAWVAMPEGFSGKLLFVTNEQGRIPVNQDGLEGLLGRCPTLDDSGEVEEVALEGTTLWYQPIPEEAASLTIVYQKWPDVVAEDDDVPTFIPPYLQRRLLAHKVAAIIWDKIEDGMDGEKINTLVQEGQYEKARVDFGKFNARRRIASMTSKWEV